MRVWGMGYESMRVWGMGYSMSYYYIVIFSKVLMRLMN